MDIPISNGPWEFGELPGIILNISDKQGHYIFECEGIKQIKNNVPIVKYEWKYIKTTRQKRNNLIRRMHENLTQYMESLGKYIKDPTPIVIPYNPIELE